MKNPGVIGDLVMVPFSGGEKPEAGDFGVLEVDIL